MIRCALTTFFLEGCPTSVVWPHYAVFQKTILLSCTTQYSISALLGVGSRSLGAAMVFAFKEGAEVEVMGEVMGAGFDRSWWSGVVKKAGLKVKPHPSPDEAGKYVEAGSKDRGSGPGCLVAFSAVSSPGPRAPYHPNEPSGVSHNGPDNARWMDVHARTGPSVPWRPSGAGPVVAAEGDAGAAH